MELSTVGTTSSATTEEASSTMGKLTTADFLKLLVTELTHQDPFDPVKNADLLNQVSSIRDLEMSSQMDKTLTNLAESNAALNETMSSMILQSNMTSAGAMIGQVVTGYTSAGERVAGNVIGVSVQDGAVMLKLDSGRDISATSVDQLLSAEAITDQLVVAVVTGDDGVVKPLVGTVSEVRVVNHQIMLRLDSGEQVALEDVAHMVPGGQLIGKSVTGMTLNGEQIEGIATGVSLHGGTVMLELDTGRQILMDSMQFTGGDAL